MNLDLYQIALPLKTNDGAGDYAAQLAVWEALALDEAGDFTDLGDRRGFWRDPDSGRVYSETMRGYQIAASSKTLQRLLRDAMMLFPDQVAFYVAHIGRAEIIVNRNHVTPKEAA